VAAPPEGTQAQATSGAVIDLLELCRLTAPGPGQGRSAGEDVRPAIDDETRPAMRVPSGEGVSVVVDLAGAGKDPALRFALGVLRQGWVEGGNPVRFRVHAKTDGRLGRDLVFDTILDPVGNVYHRTWQDHTVDLSAHAGSRVQLTFTTEDLERDGRHDTGDSAVWAHPLIHLGGDGSPAGVVLILVDTLRADHLSGHGYPLRTTPHLDRWAGRGTTFGQAVSSSCWTAPAVASLFTGRHPYGHGVRTKYALELGEDAETLAERFLGRGFFTGAISDNLLIIPGNGYAQGFQTFLVHPWDRLERGARNVSDRAIAWLEQNGERPFFLYLHYMDPHGSYTPEAPYDAGPPEMPGEIRDFVEQGDCGMVTKQIRSDAGFRLSAKEQQRLIDLYDGEIAAADFHIARVLAWLERAGRLDHTLVVVLADHGEGFGEHQVYSHAHTLHDEEVMVPLLIIPPAGTEAVRGARHGGVVRMVDLAPTILDLTGLAPAGDADGRSLAGIVLGGEHGSMAVEAYCEMAPWARPGAPLQPESALRTSGMKLMYHPGLDRYRLFDLLADPYEQIDIYDGGAAGTLVTGLGRHLTAAAEAGTERGDQVGDLDAGQRERLQALGYME